MSAPNYPTAGNSGPGGTLAPLPGQPWPNTRPVDPASWDLARWAREVDIRFHTLNGDLFCSDPDHDRSGLGMSRTPMGDLVAWIADHWTCNGGPR